MAHQNTLYLASKSPRRQELLRDLNIKFELIDNKIKEAPFEKNMLPENYVMQLARDKACAAAVDIHSGLIIGADTIVYINDNILGKPGDIKQAKEMLRMLSGCKHKVFTGIALLNAGSGKISSGYSVSTVCFRNLSDTEIDAYTASENVLDKAGAYAIQGRASLFIEKIEGDYFGIVGLSIFTLEQLFRQQGLSLLLNDY